MSIWGEVSSVEYTAGNSFSLLGFLWQNQTHKKEIAYEEAYQYLIWPEIYHHFTEICSQHYNFITRDRHPH